MDFYFLITAILGTLIGIFVGISPAIGGSFTMMTFFPVLLSLGPLHSIVFYICFRISSQYSGSVAALLFGLLGEITSYPALKERNNLQSYQTLYTGIKHTAAGSLIGTLTALLFSYFVLTSLNEIIYVLRSEIILTFLCLIIVFLFKWPGNQTHQNILLLAAGTLLGAIGFDPISSQDFLTFGNPYLSSGIPLMPVLIGFIAVPVFVSVFASFSTMTFESNSKRHTHHEQQKFSWAAAFRGSAIGSVLGLIPVVGSAVSSNIAWRIERKFSNTNDQRHSLKRLLSAESANNSAVITVLIPLFLFGIAIIPSELILFHIISAQGWNHLEMSAGDYVPILISVIVAAVLGYLICSYWIKHLVGLIKRYGRWLTVIALLITIVSVLYIGHTYYSFVYYGTLIAIFSAAGFVLRKFEFTPLVMGFMIADPLIKLANTVAQLHF
jgi:putative tricarboxylic transport membrane protein